MFSEYFKHVIEFIETDELMFAVDIIDAGEATESLTFAFGSDTDHDDFFTCVGCSLLAECLVFLKTH